MSIDKVAFVTIVFLNLQSKADEACSTGWFGQNCMFKCHCNNVQSCSDSGECIRDACQFGYFGPACQYEDVLSLENNAVIPLYLRDNKKTTCNPSSSATEVEVWLKTPSLFKWFRIEVKDGNTFNFNIELNGASHCQDEQWYRVTDTAMDILCRIEKMTRLKLVGPGVGGICYIYISGGRNVALKQSTSQTSNYASLSHEFWRSSNAVDGGTTYDISHKSCSHTDYEINPIWTVTFKRPQLLLRNKIYNRAGYQSRLAQFHLDMYDMNNATVLNYIDADARGKDNTTINFNQTYLVSSIKFSIYRPTDPVPLHICEFQAFGENKCPEKMFGLTCSSNCTCEESRICSPVTGKCSIPCATNDSTCRFDCVSLCEPDNCDYRNGKCSKCKIPFAGGNCTACTDGFYNVMCNSTCSKSCLTPRCDVKTGDCFDCVAGFLGPKCDMPCQIGSYGLNCSQNCSARCSSNCNNTNGFCDCMSDFSGPRCDECISGRYGKVCKSKCPANCFNTTCYKDDGRCVQCISGYTGPKCETEIATGIGNLIYAAIGLLFLILCTVGMMLCLAKTKKTKDSAEE